MTAVAQPAWLGQGDKPQAFIITLVKASGLQAVLAQLYSLLSEVEVLEQQQDRDDVCHVVINTDAANAWQLFQLLRERLVQTDIYLQPLRHAQRRLLICDMDMTIVDAETLDEVARLLGLDEQIAPITAAAMRGEVDFNQALAQRIALLAGQPVSLFEEVARQCRLMPGAQALLDGARAEDMHTILVSGGFAEVAEAIAQRLGFDEVYCNHLDVEDGLLTGKLIEPIVNSDYKCRLLQQRAEALGLSLEQCCALGDGANDIGMINKAGLGIAYHGKPALRAATSCQINHGDLETVLHFIANNVD